MNERARAIALLQQARDILTDRLTERLLESRDSVLEDALGLAYSSEIDAIFEQVGQRLNNINVMLNNLPPIEDPQAHQEDAAPVSPAALGYEPAPGDAPGDGGADASGEVRIGAAPSVIYVGVDGESAPEPNFQDFVRHVLAGETERAAVVLAPLVDVPTDRARECVDRFQDQLREQPQFLQKAAGMRHELATGSANGALILLWECFGLQGIEAVNALHRLRARFAAASSTPSST